MHGRSWNIPIGSSLLLCATLLSSCSRPLPTTPTSTALAPPATGTASSSTDPAAVEQLKRDRLLARGPRRGGLRVTRVHMDIVQLQPGSGYVYSLDQAEALLAQPASADARSMDYSGALSFSDQEGVCCVVYPSFRLWEDLVPYPGGGRPAPEGFAVRVRGTLMVPHRVGGADTGNWWTFAVGSDDGFRLRVSTSGRGNSGGHAGPDEWVTEYDAPRGIAVGPLLPVRFPSQGGEFPFELVYFETGGGAILHVAAAPGVNESFSPELFSLLDTTREIRGGGEGPIAD